MSEVQHHLRITNDDMAGNGGLGRYVLVPGSPSRARMIWELFDERGREIVTPRHNDSFLGTIRAGGETIDVAAVSSGMGTGSTEIITRELIHAGARRMIRVGTSGAVRYQEVRVGSFVVGTGAVRDDATSDHYMPKSYPAAAHPDVVLALCRAATRMGLADRTFRGVIQTKASLYARAVFEGPLGDEHRAWKDVMVRAGVLASEMESSTLFVMSSCLNEAVLPLSEELAHPERVLKAGTVLGVIGGKDEWGTDEQIERLEKQTCELAIEGVRELHRIDRGG
jgi:uridine phosphorylase